MSQETNNQENTEPQYTEEQLKSMRAEMIRYYSEEVKFLKKQEEFERLSADIEEHKVRKLTMMHRSAQIYASIDAAEQEAQEEPEEEPVKDTTEKPKRTLKTVE
jgi:hypothetical protein